MPAEIVPGLYRLPGVAGVNAYLWHPWEGARQAGAPMLFDCGYPWSGRGLAASLVALGVEPSNLQTIAITHDDVDHVGRLAALYAVSGAAVVAHVVEAQRLIGDTWRRLPGSPYDPVGLFVRLEDVLARRLPRQGVRVTLQVEDGAELPGGWIAVHTPGHTPGHTAYFRPEGGILMAGDAIGHTDGGKLRFPLPAYCEDMTETARSIRKLADLNPAVLCCGHGPPLYNASVPLRRFADRLAHRS
jgi:glyoxylase-like metal-dependent hydrolase (beta-lactamase superfamily II)